MPRATNRGFTRWLNHAFGARVEEGLVLADAVQPVATVDPWSAIMTNPRFLSHAHVGFTFAGPGVGVRNMFFAAATNRDMVIHGVHNGEQASLTGWYVIRDLRNPDPAHILEFPDVDAWAAGNPADTVEVRPTSFVGSNPTNRYVRIGSLAATLTLLTMASDPIYEMSAAWTFQFQYGPVPSSIGGGGIFLPVGSYLGLVSGAEDTLMHYTFLVTEILNTNELETLDQR